LRPNSKPENASKVKKLKNFLVTKFIHNKWLNEKNIIRVPQTLQKTDKKAMSRKFFYSISTHKTDLFDKYDI
jgi:hypothetical protein